MKNPTVEEVFGNLTRPPHQESELEKAIRLAKELVEKIKKIQQK